jgi:hypothetical protein
VLLLAYVFLAGVVAWTLSRRGWPWILRLSEPGQQRVRLAAGQLEDAIVAEVLAALDDGEIFHEAARRVPQAWEAAHPAAGERSWPPWMPTWGSVARSSTGTCMPSRQADCRRSPAPIGCRLWSARSRALRHARRRWGPNSLFSMTLLQARTAESGDV